ncbi:hypothetical protein BCR34DRAFT_602221 [Clohesyomyces aquaticus]|uniref:DUF7703 domain-containing protein n=1 Tax=Clohesyomyces aquaticus TaxID=1231657 RepID=A0A1Y1ZJ08_9PLEO|nr:hypothetical protein BCR34DRAFT_602221 [Clohesyomyces aquaticus]
MDPTFLRNPSNTNLLFVFEAFAAVAIWSSVPLTLRIFTTLKRRSGVYFWSMLITSWGLTIRQIGFLAQFLSTKCPWQLSLIMAQGGWAAMVSGFSMVLYSRLNIILEKRRTRQLVLAMIIFNGVIWHTAVVTLLAGIAAERNSGHRERIPRWQAVLQPSERIQIAIFSAQETAISFFYVRAAYQYLKSRYEQPGTTRSAMFQLLLVQIIIVAVDLVLIVLALAGYLQLKLFIHSFVYAVKLELEFVVLNQLVELSTMGVPGIPSFAFAVSSRQIPGDLERPGENSSPLVERTTSKAWQPSSSAGSLEFITIPQRTDSR